MSAEFSLKHGRDYPYNDRAPVDWAEAAAHGILADLMDRRGIKQELRQIEGDEEITEEIVTTMAEIIRLAHADRGDAS